MFTPIQVILLCVLVGVWTWQKYNLQMFYYASVVTMGVLTGLIMGDVQTGMLVGGAMCLMSLGLFGAGGSSVPEYPVGCIAGAAFAIAMGITGQEAVTTAMTIGVPVAALGAQLDVLGKTSGSFFIKNERMLRKEKLEINGTLDVGKSNSIYWIMGTSNSIVYNSWIYLCTISNQCNPCMVK